MNDKSFHHQNQRFQHRGLMFASDLPVPKIVLSLYHIDSITLLSFSFILLYFIE